MNTMTPSSTRLPNTYTDRAASLRRMKPPRDSRPGRERRPLEALFEMSYGRTGVTRDPVKQIRGGEAHRGGGDRSVGGLLRMAPFKDR